jgi:hypothetical protein
MSKGTERKVKEYSRATSIHRVQSTAKEEGLRESDSWTSHTQTVIGKIRQKDAHPWAKAGVEFIE